ncbi:MAG: hypothetical protein V4488_08020 [Pseudomonadota bacterium]
MKNLLRQRLDSDAAGFTTGYVPIRKQHAGSQDADGSFYGDDGKARAVRKPGKSSKARSHGGTGAYAR